MRLLSCCGYTGGIAGGCGGLVDNSGGILFGPCIDGGEVGYGMRLEYSREFGMGSGKWKVESAEDGFMLL